MIRLQLPANGNAPDKQRAYVCVTVPGKAAQTSQITVSRTLRITETTRFTETVT